MGGPDLPSTFPFRNWHPTPPHRLPELTTPCQIELLSRCPAWQSPSWEGTLCLRSPVCVAPSLGDYRHSLSEPRWELLDDQLAPSSPPVPSASVLSPSDVAGAATAPRLSASLASALGLPRHSSVPPPHLPLPFPKWSFQTFPSLPKSHPWPPSLAFHLPSILTHPP